MNIEGQPTPNADGGRGASRGTPLTSRPPKSPAEPSRARRALSRFLADYGMAVVLILICLYYAWATLKPQQVVGEAAAKQLTATIDAQLLKSIAVIVVGKAAAEDTKFVDALQSALQSSGRRVVAKVQGEPFDVRQELERLTAAGTRIDAVATTEDVASWLLWKNLPKTIPAMADVKIVAPRSYLWPTFLKAENLLNVANQVVVIALLAVGMTLVIMTGGIDLSAGSLVAISAVVSTMTIGALGGFKANASGMIAGAAAGMAVAAAMGAVSGTLITLFRLPPFIATLGMMQVASGLAYIFPKGESVYALPDRFTWLGRGASVLSIPNAVLLMVIVYVIAHVVMSRTTFGRYVYAVGGNVEAARLSGVRVRRVLLFVYVLSGATAGLGGVVLASQLKGGAPTYGNMYELYAIAAVVVGGTSLTGGSGKILGTLIGAFIIAVIQNGMNLTQVESYRQKVVLGVIILAAVMLDMFRKQGLRVFRAA